MYHIAICDDSADSLNQINTEVINFFKNSNNPFCIDTFSSGSALKNAIVFDIKIWHIIILDIEMPDISGMELAAFIRQRSSEAIIIFVTAYNQYAISAFELSIFRYIPKSVLHDKLKPALSAAVQKLDIQNSKFYLIESFREILTIPQKDIAYIFREKKYAILITKDTSFKIRKTLRKVFEDLDKDYFFFAERGYIVNLLHIHSLGSDRIILSNGKEIPVGSSHLQETRERITAHLKMRSKLL